MLTFPTNIANSQAKLLAWVKKIVLSLMKPACGVCRLSALTATNDETSIVRCFTINGYLDTNTFVPSCRHSIANKAGKEDVGQQKPGGFSGWPTCSIEAFSQLNPRGWRWQTRSDNVDVLRNRLLPEIPSSRTHTDPVFHKDKSEVMLLALPFIWHN